jgi:uncharacterized membrane protein
MKTKTIPNLDKKLPGARKAVWLCFIFFLLTLVIHGLNDNVSVTGHLLTFLLKLLPLLIFIPGMLKEHYKTYSMLGFVCLMYFTVITVNLFEPGRSIFDIFEMIGVSALFITTILFSRWKQYSIYQ